MSFKMMKRMSKPVTPAQDKFGTGLNKSVKFFLNTDNKRRGRK